MKDYEISRSSQQLDVQESTELIRRNTAGALCLKDQGFYPYSMPLSMTPAAVVPELIQMRSSLINLLPNFDLSCCLEHSRSPKQKRKKWKQCPPAWKYRHYADIEEHLQYAQKMLQNTAIQVRKEEKFTVSMPGNTLRKDTEYENHSRCSRHHS